MKPEDLTPDQPGRTTRRKSISMHEGIGVWCDCCSCEAEPRWAELAEELGIDLCDYEADEDPASKADEAGNG